MCPSAPRKYTKNPLVRNISYVILKLERTVSEPGTVSELLGGPRPKRLVTHDVKIPFGAILAITASDDGQLVDIAVLAGTSALTWAASGGD